MPKIYQLSIIFLVLGVIFAEIIPSLQADIDSTVYSQDATPISDSSAMLGFLDEQIVETALPSSDPNSPFISEVVNLSTTLDDVVNDINTGLPNNIAPSNNPYTKYSFLPTDETTGGHSVTPPIPAEDQSFIGDVIPPSGSALFYAYAEGGKAWYEESGKVIVRMPNGTTFRSFNKSTGEEIDWLQERLAYKPLSSDGALDNYINNYHGKIVAETSTWALVRFPSGGYLKIAKESSPTFLTQQSIDLPALP